MKSRTATRAERRHTEMFEFIIPGEPVAKGRPKLSRYGTYTPKKTKEYEEHIKQEWRKNGYKEPLKGAFAL